MLLHAGDGGNATRRWRGAWFTRDGVTPDTRAALVLALVAAASFTPDVASAGGPLAPEAWSVLLWSLARLLWLLLDVPVTEDCPC